MSRSAEPPARRPSGLLTRISLVLAAALLIEFVGNSLINSWQDRRLISAEHTRQVAGLLISAERIAIDAAPPQRSRLVADLASPRMALNWVPRTVITDSTPTLGALQAMKVSLVEAQPGLAARDLRLSLIASPTARQRDLLGALRLADGSFVTFRVAPFINAQPGFAVTVAFHLALVAGVLGAALLTVRALVRPLRNLAEAADATGRGAMPQTPLEGPREVQQVTVAFRAMQDRLMRMMDDQTQALVAVSHDVRTPVQRLRLRAALLVDDEMREAMTGDLIDIEKFLGSVLDYVRSGETEALRLVDIAAIAMTVVDNAADAGAAITYRGPDALSALVPPLALKRALGNLVENAIAHAAQVQVSLAVAGGEITLSVEDDGPGIPATARDEALLPFRRLNGKSAGAGLGLAIVRAVAQALPGELSLEDSPLGGLAARIRFTPPMDTQP